VQYPRHTQRPNRSFLFLSGCTNIVLIRYRALRGAKQLAPSTPLRHLASMSHRLPHLTPDEVEEEARPDSLSPSAGCNSEAPIQPAKLPSSAIGMREKWKKAAMNDFDAEDECENMFREQLAQLEQLAESHKQARRAKENTEQQQQMDHYNQAKCEDENNEELPSSVSTESPDFEIGAKVEVRSSDDQKWKQGRVASIDPLTVIVGDDLVGFEYKQVRAAEFEIGAEVEARDNEDQMWEHGIVASGKPLTVFVGDSAMAFEYKHVRPISSKDTLPLTRWYHAIVVLALIVQTMIGSLGWNTARPFLDLGVVEGKPSLLGKTWLGYVVGETSKSPQENTTATVQTLRELGHLRLSMSDCTGAEIWFSRSLAQLKADSAVHDDVPGVEPVVANRSQFAVGEHMSLIGERGFALVCAQRFQEGAATLEHAMRLGAIPPHQVNARGYALFHSQEYGRARDIFDALMQTTSHSKNPILWNNLAAASMSVGDTSTAENALHRALHLVKYLKPATQNYYTQVVSNNIHILRGHPSTHGRLPTMEIFNCMPLELKDMANAMGPAEFESKFVDAITDKEDKPLDAPDLMNSRSAVLAIDPEPIFCP